MQARRGISSHHVRHARPLGPGESVYLPRRLYHKFWGEKGSGKTLLGEVSKVNDDTSRSPSLRPLSFFLTASRRSRPSDNTVDCAVAEAIQSPSS